MTLRHARYEDVAVPYPKRSRWAAGIVLGIALTMVGAQVDNSRLDPLQQAYLPSYVRASIVSAIASYVSIPPANDYPTLEFQIRPSPARLYVQARWLQLDATGKHLELLPEIVSGGGHSLRWTIDRVPHIQYRDDIGSRYFDGRGVLSLFRFALGLGIPGLILGTVFGKLADWKYEKKIRHGIPIRGPFLTDRHTFNTTRKSDGIGFATTDPPTVREFCAAPRAPARMLAIPRALESSHMLIMGDTGTGKSVLIRQLLRGIQSRGEGAIVFDPEGEFTAEFYNEARGDVILNPLDKRSLYWNASDELATNDEALTLAASLFPESSDEKVKFFRMAPRKIFAHLIQYNPDPVTLARWLAVPSEIDVRVAGTEMAQMISKGAQSQRAGVLSSLAEIADAFRLLRPRADCQRTWTARSWAKDRKGWIFLTATPTIYELQRPLITLWIDSLILRLMSTPSDRQVWLIIDELASLRELGQLETALTRARKHRLNLILGCQIKSQIEDIYGRYRAETILSMPATRINFRTSNPDSADWLSKAIGDHDLARARETQSQSDGSRSGTSASQSWEVRTERLVSPAQIQGLQNLHGYLKNENLLVPYTLALVPRVANVPPLDLRPGAAAFKPLVTPSDQALAEMRAADERAEQEHATRADNSSVPPEVPSAAEAVANAEPATVRSPAKVPERIDTPAPGSFPQDLAGLAAVMAPPASVPPQPPAAATRPKPAESSPETSPQLAEEPAPPQDDGPATEQAYVDI